MKKETVEFMVETKNGVVDRIGKSSISNPKTNFDHKGIKWFDDSKLQRKNPEQKNPVLSITIEVGVCME